MPAGPRIRANNSFGVTTDNPLTAGSTTFNSAGLATLPVVSAAHAVVVLDPKRLNGEPEIVVVTSHTASATVATIQRGQYGTVARSHPQGTPWAHVPIDEDYIEVLTSSTRPGNPYEGQMIFEADTNKLVGYGGVDWAPRDAGGTLGRTIITSLSQAVTTITDLTGMSVLVMVGTGRIIKIIGKVFASASAINVRSQLAIREGTDTLNSTFVIHPVAATNETLECVHIIVSPTAGSHTYKLSGVSQGGTSTFGAATTTPSFILVEDIGAA